MHPTPRATQPLSHSATQPTDMSASALIMTPAMRGTIDTAVRAMTVNVDDCLAELAKSVEAYSNLRAKLSGVITDDPSVITDMSGKCQVIADDASIGAEMSEVMQAHDAVRDHAYDLSALFREIEAVIETAPTVYNP
jgi:hypothetical protein